MDTLVDDPLLGTTLAGKYKVVRALGQGGMGAVYEGQNLHTERRVAVKVMRPEHAHRQEFADRFLREARAAGRIEHPHVVSVIDVGEDAEIGCLFLVMEYMPGHDLRHALAPDVPMPFREVSEIVVPVMSALAAAHATGVVHRDIKPENVFLVRSTGGGAQPRVIDFGIAKLITQDGVKSLTGTGAPMGTPYYMSPEQAKGERDVGVQTDVWAVGVLAFEMLTGRCPIEGENFVQLMANILMGPIPRADNLVPTVPRDVADVIVRALQRDRALRFATMDELLGAWLGCPAVAGTDWGRELTRRFAPGHTVEGFVAATTVPPGVVANVLASSTLGLSATAVAARASTRRAWTFGGIAVAGVFVGVVAFAQLRGAPKVQVMVAASPAGATDAGVVRVTAPAQAAKVSVVQDAGAVPTVRVSAAVDAVPDAAVAHTHAEARGGTHAVPTHTGTRVTPPTQHTVTAPAVPAVPAVGVTHGTNNSPILGVE